MSFILDRLNISFAASAPVYPLEELYFAYLEKVDFVKKPAQSASRNPGKMNTKYIGSKENIWIEEIDGEHFYYIKASSIDIRNDF